MRRRTVFTTHTPVEAGHDRFFLEVDARDPRFDRGATEEALREAGAVDVFEVPR